MSYQQMKEQHLQNEIKALKRALVMETAQRIKDLDDAYPDVGWGKSWGTCVAEALHHHSLTEDDINA